MKPSGASLLAVLLFVFAIIAAIALSGGGAGLATWLAGSGIQYLALLAIVIGALFGALWLVGRMGRNRRR